MRASPSFALSKCFTQHYDTDGDGFITREELTQALAADTADSAQLNKDVLQALQEADRNKDGRIDYTVRGGRGVVVLVCLD